MCSFKYSKQYIALAQLRSALKSEAIKEKRLLLDGLMKRGLDVHYAIPLDAPVAQHAPELVGWTALHFAIKAQDEEIIFYIIRLAAKVTAINNHAFSPIRLAIEYPWSQQRCGSLRGKGIIKHPVVESLLKAQRDQNDTSNSSCKLGVSHLHIACMVNDARTVEFLLRSGASAEAMISADSPHLAGFRPIHVAVRYCALESLKLLLDSGANLWAREARGLNPLQLLIECNLELVDAMRLIDGEPPSLFEVTLLSNVRMADLMLARWAVVSHQDEYGLERLHVAASMWDSALLVDTLKVNPEINVNAAISEDSPHWPGYTPLHFAARCGVNAVKVLAKRGASLSNVDACGITPFDLCLNRCEPGILSEIISFDETIKSVTFNTSSDVTLCDAVKALQSTHHLDAFRRMLETVNEPVSLDSPWWPGCTLLHLAVTLVYPNLNEPCLNKLGEEFNVYPKWRNVNSLNTERTDVLAFLLSIVETNPIAQDVRNSSPVHLAFRQGKFMVVKKLLNRLVVHPLQKFDNVADSDGLSLLHISSVVDNYEVVDTLLLNNADVNVRSTSALRLRWYDKCNIVELYLNPRSTPLHFAVASKSDLIELLIEKGADPLAIDAEGLTPLLLTFITRPDYSSKIHAKKLLSIPSVSTTDVSIEGLSHLHIACWSDSIIVVKSLLAQGVDINAKINCGLNDTYTEYPRALKSPEYYYTSSQGTKESLATYAGYTPLHFSVEEKSIEVIELLVERGADIHIRNARGMSPLHMALLADFSTTSRTILDCFLENVVMPKCGPIDDYGITQLHIACRNLDSEWVKQLMISGSDVNARIATHSPIWPGDTPLHVLTNDKSKNLTCLYPFQASDMRLIVKLLITQGADITLPNADNVTPLHAITVLPSETSPQSIVYEWNQLKIYLGNKLKRYDVNQMNTEGLSFIHIACLANNMEMITELCNQGADVNRPTDHFAEELGGCGPLHFAAMINNPKMVQFLIEKGANVIAEDCHGCTPLHVFCQYGVNREENVTSTLCEHGVGIEARDVLGRTPLEILVQNSVCERSSSPFVKDQVVISLLSCGACFNTVNPLSRESLFCKAISMRARCLQDNLRNARDTDILAVMDDGSTAIHNSARGYVKELISAEYYISVIEELLKRGCSINAQDNRGRTALHVAVEHDNYLGVCSLLAAGVNANIADNDGNVVLSLCSEITIKNQKIHLALLMYLHKLILLGLEVSEPNRRLYERARGFPPNEANYLQRKILKEISGLKEVKLHGSFSLRDLMLERTVSEYTTMPRTRRDAIVERLVSSELYERYPSLRSPIRYQYRRLEERVVLIEPAKHVLGLITDNVSSSAVPELCLDIIINFLNNEDLKILIEVGKPLQNKAADNEFMKCKKVKYF